MKRLPPNEKEAPRVSLQEPQDSIDKAAQPEQPIKGDGSSDANELQAKMKAAAKEFYELLMEKMHLKFWPGYEGIPLDRHLFTELSPYVQCTPEAIFYSFKGQWIRLTEENLKSAPGALEDVHKAFKKYGKVSWVSPKLGRKKGGAVV